MQQIEIRLVELSNGSVDAEPVIEARFVRVRFFWPPDRRRVQKLT